MAVEGKQVEITVYVKKICTVCWSDEKKLKWQITQLVVYQITLPGGQRAKHQILVTGSHVMYFPFTFLYFYCHYIRMV